MKILKYNILFVLFLVALLFSVILSFFPTPAICSLNGGCDVVHDSPYNYTFGIQNSYFGIPIFLVLTFLAFSQIKHPTKTKRKWINRGVLLGGLVAVYFLVIQAFVLKSYCHYCLVVDISILASLAIVLFTEEKIK